VRCSSSPASIFSDCFLKKLFDYVFHYCGSAVYDEESCMVAQETGKNTMVCQGHSDYLHCIASRPSHNQVHHPITPLIGGWVGGVSLCNQARQPYASIIMLGMESFTDQPSGFADNHWI
jgi:hypothetical protein